MTEKEQEERTNQSKTEEGPDKDTDGNELSKENLEGNL